MTWSAARTADGSVFVQDDNGDRLCEIPMLAQPWKVGIRSTEERESIAGQIARLLNEESARCHVAPARSKEAA
jgi:predicted component of type VI protein secretion system